MNYGFIITTYNDADDASKMFESLKSTIPPGDTYKIAVIDAGSIEQQREIIESNIGAITYTHKDLSVALNAGYYALMGYDPDGSNIDSFIDEGNTSVDHMFWIHTDCRFYQNDWAKKLIKIYEHVWPLVGRMSPGTSNIDSSLQELQQGNILRESNNCPTLVSAEFCRLMLEADGFIYDPKYKNIGGLEDIDLWQRLHKMGMLSCTCSLVDVWHHGAGIRFRRDTSQDQIKNRELYHSRWDAGIWNDRLGPVCGYDLSEINQELLNKFGELREEIIQLVPKRNKITKEERGRYYERKYNE